VLSEYHSFLTTSHPSIPTLQPWLATLSLIRRRQKLDSTMPPHKKYLGMKRNVFLLVLLVALLALLALVIGLAVGLTQKSKYESQNPYIVHSLTIASANRRIYLYLRTARLSLAISRIIRQVSALVA
jgi:hypothetical protein